MDSDLERVIGAMTDLWVFGYGSVLWHQGFDYCDQLVGYVDGYVRRFWQGNITHRGTPGRPGRVATLIEQAEGRVWGVAYHLHGCNQIKLALDHLGLRECLLGGYACQSLTFTERITTHSNGLSPRKIPVLTFVATPSNALYLGPVDLDTLASQVIGCRGNSGSNTEYVIRIAEFVHANIPEDDDEHLFILERKIREKLESEKLDNEKDSTFSTVSPPQLFLSSTDSNNLFLGDCRKDNKQEEDSIATVTLLKERFLIPLLMASKTLDNYNEMPKTNFSFKIKRGSLQAENIALSA